MPIVHYLWVITLGFLVALVFICAGLICIVLSLLGAEKLLGKFIIGFFTKISKAYQK